MADFKQVMNQNKAGGFGYVPLVQQIAQQILDDKRNADMHDIEYIPAASQLNVGNLLMSSFSRIGLKAKPKPTDNSVVVIFALGGITCAEIRELRENFAKQKVQLIIGSNAIATPSYVFENLFGTKNKTT
eukprot:TRINITY_DN12055_c0_g1_i1.p1 TRINITY_DN12055_c0_g1~~TRINITY_DN12055_c0_g1_i1.p1  ORF type:complete len:149 (-),score=43.58 TRINITY_DN12055_c0_g1_i1:2-391(-)